MEKKICPETGQEMTRGVNPLCQNSCRTPYKKVS